MALQPQRADGGRRIFRAEGAAEQKAENGGENDDDEPEKSSGDAKRMPACRDGARRRRTQPIHASSDLAALQNSKPQPARKLTPPNGVIAPSQRPFVTASK